MKYRLFGIGCFIISAVLFAASLSAVKNNSVKYIDIDTIKSNYCAEHNMMYSVRRRDDDVSLSATSDKVSLGAEYEKSVDGISYSVYKHLSNSYVDEIKVGVHLIARDEYYINSEQVDKEIYNAMIDEYNGVVTMILNSYNDCLKSGHIK